MTARVPRTSPQTYARVGGILYLFVIVAALFGEAFVRQKLIVWGDAAMTASNILAAETLFRVGLAGELLTCVCDVALAMILYVLLAPVSRSLASLAALFRLTFVAVYAVAKLFMLAAVVALKGGDQLKGFDAQQVNDLAYLALRMHGQGYGVSLIFFGLTCLLLGLLIYRSGYLPRSIGALLVIGAVGYLINSFTLLLEPALAARQLPWILLPAFVAELALAMWLLVKGVDLRSPSWDPGVRE